MNNRTPLTLVAYRRHTAITTRGKLDELSTLIERAQLQPHVGAVYSLAEIPLAHAWLESPHNGVQGKIPIAVYRQLSESMQ